MMHFDGPDYDAVLDEDRLTAQLSRVKRLMLDGRWRTLREISNSTLDPPASVSARLRDLRKSRFGAYLVERRRRGPGIRGLFEYRVVAPAELHPPLEEAFQ